MSNIGKPWNFLFSLNFFNFIALQFLLDVYIGSLLTRCQLYHISQPCECWKQVNNTIWNFCLISHTDYWRRILKDSKILASFLIVMLSTFYIIFFIRLTILASEREHFHQRNIQLLTKSWLSNSKFIWLSWLFF